VLFRNSDSTGGRGLFFRAGPVLLFLVATIVLLGADALHAQNSAGVYRIGPTDNLRITVFGHEDLSGEFLVSGTGHVSLPLVGEVRVGGLSVREVAESVTSLLKPDYLRNPRVSVDVLNYRPFYILGEVKKPGSYPYEHGMKILTAVALAGGFTYRAQEDKLVIIRANAEGKREDIVGPDTAVLPGDVVKVKERYF
jgi:protein involved in polysaccharide export with SLBB domain